MASINSVVLSGVIEGDPRPGVDNRGRNVIDFKLINQHEHDGKMYPNMFFVRAVIVPGLKQHLIVSGGPLTLEGALRYSVEAKLPFIETKSVDGF